MLTRMSIEGLDPETIRENVAQARARRERALQAYAVATAELSWWLAGLRLIQPEPGRSAEQRVADALSGWDRAGPTLRQAILLVMRADTTSDWTLGDLAFMLRLNNWLPKREDPNKGIADMAAAMVTEGMLERSGRGVYRLPMHVAAALQEALPPITDYRRADELGFSVPDHPAAGRGLRE